MRKNGDVNIELGQGGEFDAIRSMLQLWGNRARGVGDDAAMLAVPAGECLVASTDASVEGVHFRREWFTAREIGSRAAAAALSDLAAMGAAPLGMLLALALPERWRSELDELARGVGDLSELASCPIVGGNMSRAEELSLTITVLGSAARPLERSGAKVGDVLYVTGRLGGAGAALDALLSGATPDAEHRARLAAPLPRLAEARWLVAHGATAAIDISDGLAADAGHLASASGLKLELDVAAIPCMSGVTPEAAVRSGEEYELLVSFPEAGRPDTASFEAEFGVPLTRIGHAVVGAGVELLGSSGRVDPPRGHDHLS